MFFLLYRQKDTDKIIEVNDRNYVIDNLTCEIMENKPLGSRVQFLWILRVVYFPVKYSCLYNEWEYRKYSYYRKKMRWILNKIKIDIFLPEMLCIVVLAAENGEL